MSFGEELFPEEELFFEDGEDRIVSAALVGCGIAMALECTSLGIDAKRHPDLPACNLEERNHRVTGAGVCAVVLGAMTPTEAGCKMAPALPQNFPTYQAQ